MSTVLKLASVDKTSVEERISVYTEVWLTTHNKTKAYGAAGYKCVTPSNAYNFHKRYWKEIQREAHMLMHNHIPKAIDALADLMVNARSETAKCKAAIEILDRCGFDKTTKVQIQQEDPKSQQELQEELKVLLEANGGDFDFLSTEGES